MGLESCVGSGVPGGVGKLRCKVKKRQTTNVL